MADRTSFTTVSDGDVLSEGYFNGIYYARRRINQVYSGTGFDATRTATTTGSTSNSVELTALTATQLTGANYLIITACVSARSRTIRNSGDTSSGTPSIHIETKEVGGSYNDSLAKVGVVSSSNLGTDGTHDNTVLTTVRWVHTLTAGEKSNGVQVKITGYADTSNNVSVSATATITNKMTTIETSD